jgi:hypothetical protein
MMETDQRVRHLLRAAQRAEGEGDVRTARNFRLMAADARPAGSPSQARRRDPAA